MEPILKTGVKPVFSTFLGPSFLPFRNSLDRPIYWRTDQTDFSYQCKQGVCIGEARRVIRQTESPLAILQAPVLRCEVQGG
jgi:hypothetical protein